jgi:hypothetical protein
MRWIQVREVSMILRRRIMITLSIAEILYFKLSTRSSEFRTINIKQKKSAKI